MPPAPKTPKTPKNREFVATAADPVLAWLLANVEGMSRDKAKSLLRLGAVRVNGKTAFRHDEPVAIGDAVVLLGAPPTEKGREAPTLDIPFEILFEDEQIVAIDKPAGLLTIGTERERFETAHRILGDREIERGGPEGRVFVVHRLDRDTSGVVLFAKTEEAKRRLQIHWEKVEKHYVAVVDGVPAEPEGRLTHWLREDVSGLRVNVVEPGHPYGYKSITSYRVTATGEGRAILAVKAETGRKHQIRAQLSTMGTPVCGDVRYGSPRKASRLALHAAKLTFPHPGTGELVTLEAPVPPKLLSMIKKPRPQRPRPRRK